MVESGGKGKGPPKGPLGRAAGQLAQWTIATDREIALPHPAGACGDHHRARPRENGDPVLIKRSRLHRDDAHIGAGLTDPSVSAQRFGEDGVADVDRGGEFNVGPAQVGDGILAHVDHR